jgi:long-chain acyl-CoA synthetase
MSLLTTVAKHAVTRGKEVAIIDDQGRYTYQQVVGAAMFIAQEIERMTDRPNVGILLPTGAGAPIAMLGCWLARRTAIPFNYLLNKDELAWVIGDSDIDLLISVGPMLDFVGGRDILPWGVQVLDMAELDFTGPPPLRWPPIFDGDETAVILYTSGTSGRPKGVMLTHDNIERNAWAGIEHSRIVSADVFLGVLPQFHSFGLTALTMIPLAVGARVVYTARFIPAKVIDLIRKHKPQVIMAVPSMYGALLSVKKAEPTDFESVRFAISGGEPLPSSVFEAYMDRFNLKLLEGYGLTETSPAMNWATNDRWKRHSVGQSLPGQTTVIVDDANRILPTNTEGEIMTAGPFVMKGYYKRPDLTAGVMCDLQVPDEEGVTRTRTFFRTGDIGRIDDDGYLYITGRKKEMLIIGGENVFPREIEEIINRHPDVRDAAVIGRQDDMRGEVPIAFVEMEEGKAFDEAGIRKLCRDNLAGYKVPKEIRVLPALPRNGTGKILRRQLKAD